MDNVSISGITHVAHSVRLLRKGMVWLRQFPVFPIATLLLVLVIPSVFADYVAPYDPKKGNVLDRLQPPAVLLDPGQSVPGGPVLRVDFGVGGHHGAVDAVHEHQATAFGR